MQLQRFGESLQPIGRSAAIRAAQKRKGDFEIYSLSRRPEKPMYIMQQYRNTALAERWYNRFRTFIQGNLTALYLYTRPRFGFAPVGAERKRGVKRKEQQSLLFFSVINTKSVASAVAREFAAAYTMLKNTERPPVSSKQAV